MEKEILYRYFEGKTTAEEENSIMEWANASSENYNSYLEARQLWCALLLHAKPKEISKTVLSGGFPLRRIAGLSAAAAILACIMLCFVSLYNYGSRVQQIVVPRGQRVELTLADGSRVWLNSKSRLEYSSLFGVLNRNVRLSGEGYFEVAEGSTPFVVATEEYDVKVHGTTFNVYAFDGNPTFETSLLNGCVEIIPHNGEASMTLAPNQMAVSTGNSTLRRMPIQDVDRLRWIEGMICLNNVPFGELVERFSSYFDTDIKLHNPSLFDVHCTGKFRQSDGIDHTMKVLQSLLNFEYTHNSKNNTIDIY